MIYVTKENTRFKAVRSGGPGGQNVNKRATKIQIWVKVTDLPISDENKKLLMEKLSNHINKNGELEIFSEEERSQEQNHERALERMNEIIEDGLKVSEPRIPTEVPEGIEEKFREIRKLHSLKKKHRHEAKNPETKEHIK